MSNECDVKLAKYSTNDSRTTAIYKNCSANDISYNDITRRLGLAQTESIIGRGSWVCSFQGEDGDEDDDDVDEGVEDGEDVDEDDEEHDEDAKEHDEDVDYHVFINYASNTDPLSTLTAVLIQFRLSGDFNWPAFSIP